MDILAVGYICKEHSAVIHLNVPHVGINTVLLHKKSEFLSNGLAVLTRLET
jgi:hypothetical protein